MRDLASTLFKDEYRLSAQHKGEHLLERVMRGREMLAVIPDGQSAEYASLLLHLDRSRGELVIDELNPAAGNAALQVGQTLFCMGRADGVYAGFRGTLLRRADWDGYGALVLSYPQAVYHLQRRSFYRVPVSPGDLGPVTLERRGARDIQGQCQDISASGMRLRVHAPTDFALSDGELLPQVRFQIGSETLQTEAQVRFARPLRNTRDGAAMRLVGLQFRQPGAAFEQRVMHYVQRRDRELLRDGRL